MCDLGSQHPLSHVSTHYDSAICMMWRKMQGLTLIWGMSGLFSLLLWAMIRLALITAEALSLGLNWHHWLVLLLNLALMAYYEGYRGFQKNYAPRFAARLRYLRDTNSAAQRILAPLFCMGFFHASKRRLITTYALTLGIVILVVLFHRLSQPWRGILDAGVVLGLAWGLVSTAVFCYMALSAPSFRYSPELPTRSADSVAQV